MKFLQFTIQKVNFLFNEIFCCTLFSIMSITVLKHPKDGHIHRNVLWKSCFLLRISSFSRVNSYCGRSGNHYNVYFSFQNNFAVENFTVKKEGFLGMTCSWYITPNSHRDPLFSCISSSDQDTADLQGRIVEASVTIPDNLFKQLQDEQEMNLTSNVYNILVSMQSSSKLFSIDEDRYRIEDVTTDVVGLKLGKFNKKYKWEW